MTQYSGGGGMGIGGQGDPLLGDPSSTVAGAASAALPQDPTANAMELIKNLSAARSGFASGGMIPGPQMPKPIMPQAPTHGSEVGIPQGPFGTVGERKRADKQALFSSIGNLVNKAQDKLYQKKVETIQHDFEKLSAAIQGYKEGEATGNREQMAHNAKIMNDIVMDPKKGKELSKAFEVNLNPMADGGKGKKEKPNPAADAAKAFFSKNMQDFQAGRTQLSPQAQTLMQSMPQTLQPDPRYQQYLEGLKAGAFPKAGEILTFDKGVMDVQEKLQANKFTNDTKMQMAKNLAQAMLNRTLMQQYGQTLRTQLMQIGAGERADVMAEALKYRADQVLKGQSDRTNMLRDRLAASTNDYSKKLTTLMKGLDDAAKKNSKDIEDAKKNHDTARLQWLNQQADGIAFQQRLVNDKAEQQVGIDPSIPPDQKNMGLSDSEYLLFKEIFTEQTQPTGTATSEEE